MRLNDKVLSHLKPPPNGQIRIRDDLLPGFGVIVGQRAKTFFVMYGKDRRIQTLGRYPSKSLQDARNDARRVLERPEDKNRVESLFELHRAFLKDCRTRLRPKSVAAYETVLKNAPDIPISKANKLTVPVNTAHEIKAYKAMFNWAIREEITDRNPFLHLTAKFGKRERVLSDDELRAVWHYDYPPYSTIVKVLILSGQRVGQIAQYDPAWLQHKVITFPADVMKMGRTHAIPATPLLTSYLPKKLVTFNGWSNAKIRMDRVTGVTEYTLHDLRRTYATIHAKLGTPIHVIEAILNHTSGTISGVAAIYIRHNFLQEMRVAQLRFEKHLRKILSLGQ